jgi:uncharacterized membrane protein
MRLFALLLLASLAAAQGLDIFGTPEGAPAPPPIDEEGVPVLLVLKYFDSKQPVSDAHVEFEIADAAKSGEAFRTIKYVLDGTAEFRLTPGNYRVFAGVDNLSTPGKDYAATELVTVANGGNATVFFKPAGSVRGLVFGPDGKAVPNAHVIAECPGGYGETLAVSNALGGFSFGWLPIGACRLGASASGRVGFVEVTVSQGEVASANVILSEEVATDQSSLVLLAIIVLLAVLSAVAYFFISRQKPAGETPTTHAKPQPAEGKPQPAEGAQHAEAKPQPAESQLSPRQQDILKTLNEREKKIVHALSERGPLNLGKLSVATMTPKTSLLRVMAGLERKNIIKIEKLENIVRISLSDWFREK